MDQESRDKFNASLAMLREFRSELNKIVTHHTVADFETALQMVLNPPSKAEWMDISLAPKDGTRILIIGGKYFHEASSGEFEAGIDEPVIAEWCDIGNHWQIANTCGYLEYVTTPFKKWQPLPQPPIAGGKKDA